MPTILDEIVAQKRVEIAAAKRRVSQVCLEEQLAGGPPVRGFAAALRTAGAMRIIAEVKKASPSAGVIRADFDPVAIAKIYEANGAACFSVLTDEQFFQGRLEYLAAIHDDVSLPLLRKEFILERYQLLESRVAGADAVLLIAEILPGDSLAKLYTEARTLGLDVLVELHDADQLPRVLDLNPMLVGINNRNLKTFETRLDHTLDLMKDIPDDVTVISESGICTQADLDKLAAAGVSGVLVGESLMRAADIGLALRGLTQN
jgi:indole-3-glycerol phosphate synthase